MAIYKSLSLSFVEDPFQIDRRLYLYLCSDIFRPKKMNFILVEKLSYQEVR